MKVHKNNVPRMSITTRGNPKYSTEIFRATVRMGLGLALALMLALPATAQILTIEGVVMSVNSATTVSVKSGGVTFQSSGAADNAGTIRLEGNWTNNASGLINGSAGTVVLDGASQTIGGSNSTTFHNLTLEGTGVKSLAVDATVSSVLALNDRELATGSNAVFVTNTSSSAITFSSGFISSAVGGATYRDMAAVSTYVFPVGVAGKFRPVDITPTVSSAHRFCVRMVNNDPTSDGFDRDVNDDTECSINSMFYHLISRVSGASAADVGIYYAPADGPFNNLVHWQGAPRWETMAPTSGGAGYGLSSRIRAAWNNFTMPPFALAEEDLTPPVITCPSDTTINCNTDTSVASTGMATATDLCTSVTLVWADSLVAGSCPSNYKIYRKFTATDGNDNSSNCTQLIMVQDTTRPVITFCPANVSVICISAIPAVNASAVTATDNCDASPVKTHQGDTNDGGNFCAGIPRLITRTYRVTDNCGNFSECQQIITLNPTPVTVTCPANRTVYPGYPGNECTTLTMTGIGGGCGPGYALEWRDGSTGMVVGTTASITVCPTSSRCYIAKVTDANGCMATCTTRVCVVNVDCSNNANSQKALVCHVPPGNPGNAHTICISVNALSSHIGLHGGDYIGPCRANPGVCTGGCTGSKSEVEPLADNLPNAMLDAYPNPFSNGTTLKFRFDTNENVSLQVFNLNGQLVANWYVGQVEAGVIYEREFRPEDLSGGMYIAKLTTDSGISLSRKLVFAK